jgi:hypothetical protein
MIYFDGLESIIECEYLTEELSDRAGTSQVFVNPDAIGYLIGKTVIINRLGYPEEKIKELVEKQNCRVISRLYTEIPKVEFHPYILRICDSVMWSGRDIENFPPRNKFSTMLENEQCSFSLSDYVLYFPRVYNHSGYSTDDKGNLTALGWALQQVGINVKNDTPFINLDVIKSKKVAF